MVYSLLHGMMFQVMLLAISVGVGANVYFPSLESQQAAVQEKDFAAYAALHGMNLSSYEAETSDGWILQLWRVRCMSVYDEELSTPVIFAHGIGGSAFDFLWNARNESAAFIFADHGYDVWLINWRGNHFSNRIREADARRKPTSTEYYRAAWQNMADLDLPRVLDKVSTETTHNKVYLVGHSMGGVIPFAFLSENHSYDNRIMHYTALTPVMAFRPDVSLPEKLVRLVAPRINRSLPEFLFRLLYGMQAFAYPDESFAAFVQSIVCKITPICRVLIDVIFHRDMRKLVWTDSHSNKSRLQIYLAEEIGGLGFMAVLNFFVQFGKDPWTKIDYDYDAPQTGFTNLEVYGKEKPPSYDFPAIKVPVSLFFVEKDNFITPDARRATIQMLNATDVRVIERDNFSHVDVVLATDARCYIYDHVLSNFKELETGRGESQKDFRSRVETHLEMLPFEDGCRDKTN